jgi:hypothetical protein
MLLLRKPVTTLGLKVVVLRFGLIGAPMLKQ